MAERSLCRSLCRSTLVKFILVSLNILYAVIGLVILTVGVWVLINGKHVMLNDVTAVEALISLVLATAGIYMAIGFFVLIIGFLGCYGAVEEKPSFLLAYVAVVGCILVLQVVTGIFVMVFDDEILFNLSEAMNRTVTEKYDGESELSKAYNFMHHNFKCCAANGPDDWKTSKWQLDKEKANVTIKGFDKDPVVPLTCCALKSYSNGKAVVADPNKCMAAAKDPYLRENGAIHAQGCYDKVERWIRDNVSILLGIAFGFVVLEAIGMILALYLRTSIKRGYEAFRDT